MRAYPNRTPLPTRHAPHYPRHGPTPVRSGAKTARGGAAGRYTHAVLVAPNTKARLLTTDHGDHDRLHLVGKVYVRGPRNRLLELDFTPESTVWWATQRALIALNDLRDPSECRLLLHGQVLRPRRSLARSGVCDGDTLDLVATETTPRHSRLATRLDQAIGRLGLHVRPQSKQRDT